MSIAGVAQAILLGETDLEVRSYLETALRCQGYTVEVVEYAEQVLECLRTSDAPFSAIVLDAAIPGCNHGTELLKEVRRLEPGVPIIVTSELDPPVEIVAAMMSTGASDFLTKPPRARDFWNALRLALGRGSLATARGPTVRSDSSMWFGDSPAMRSLHCLLDQIARADVSILIQGETGTGKEVFARELHARSRRAGKPLVKLNCVALPSELVESELFGYERGAFTGAFQRKVGIFEIADRGTILLDEIGDMDLKLQAKLLQVLQDQSFQRLGGRELIRVDVRIIAATHRNLERAVADNVFREDLYYRLNVVKVRIPPLRERAEDIGPLAEFLLDKHAEPGTAPPELPPYLRNVLLDYTWPGNIRELENTMRNLLVLRDPELICRELRAAMKPRVVSSAPTPISRRAEHFPGKPMAIEATAASPFPGSPEPLLRQVARAKQDAEMAAIVSALQATRWNRRQAAMLLEIDYKALLYKIKKLGIKKEDQLHPVELTVTPDEFLTQPRQIETARKSLAGAACPS